MAPMSSNMAPMSSNMAPMSSNMAPKAPNMAPMSSNMAPMSSNMAPMSSNMAPMSSNMMPMVDKSCVPQETVITDVQLAQAYVPFEKMCTTFTPLSGLKNGTIFPPLHEVSGWERKRMGDI